MKDMGIVYGSAAMAKPIVVSKDTIYIHTNINAVEGEEGLYSYSEAQYGVEEYVRATLVENHLLAEKVKESQDQLTETQLALCEVYELVAGTEASDG
jgi:hypothetical protein